MPKPRDWIRRRLAGQSCERLGQPRRSKRQLPNRSGRLQPWGTGTWTIELQNAWLCYECDATWDMDITWFGVCEGDCVIPTACNYNPSAELANNAICIFAEELYPSGLLDCDGNCYNDDDGDGICNELEVPGCQVLWACNYNDLATDPPRQTSPARIQNMMRSIVPATVCCHNS